MGKYKVTTDGGTYIVTTEDSPQTSDSTGSYMGDVVQNAGKELKGMVQSIPPMVSLGKDIMSTPGNVVRYPLERAMGIPQSETSLANSGRAITALPQIAKQVVTGTLNDFGNLVMHPVDTFREKPISTVANVASVVAPAIKGIGAITKGAEATSVSANAVREAFAKTANIAFGVSEDAAKARMANPAGVKSAFSNVEVANHMVDSTKNLDKTITHLDEIAKDKLSSSRFLEDGAIPKTQIADAIRLAKKDLGGVFSEANKAAANALKKVSENYKKLTNTVSQKQVKELVQQMDKDIPWTKPKADLTAEDHALIDVRMRLDSYLKDSNPEYAKAIAPVEDAITVKNDFMRTFGLKADRKRGVFASDATVPKLKSALKDSKVETQAVLDRYKTFTGEDFQSKLRNTAANDAFYGGETNGSRRTAPLTLIGSSVAGVPGGVAGYIAGSYLDKYGKNVAGAIADVLANPKMNRYMSVLDKAAVKGPRNVLAVHAALMEKDKNYASEINKQLSSR